MTFWDILYTILLGPLELIFEVIYMLANRFIGHPGLAIIVLSLIMNLLVLPLYRRSDAMQEAARDVEDKLRDGVNHIKKTFSGDERMMILQTYYRQNNYKPTDALNGSVSLLLEVPFFMAAYNFLSHLGAIQGVSLGPITDLGAPDALLTLGEISINILPVLMTVINIISSAIYVKGFPLKTKIQLYGMALFFLVFLYTSPAGLVFYWTLNNLFSLVKTMFYKLKNAGKVLGVLSSVAGLVLLGYVVFFNNDTFMKHKLFVIILGVICQVPIVWGILKDEVYFNFKKVEYKNDKKIFVLGTLFLTMLVGGLIPSALVAASPQEFFDLNSLYNPLWYVGKTFCLSLGTFCVWFGVFYWIANDIGKAIFDKIVWILCGIMLVNYMFFGTDLGIISAGLQFENGIAFSASEEIVNLLVVLVLAVVMYFIGSKWKVAVGGVLLTAVIALTGMSALNVVSIHNSLSEVDIEEYKKNIPEFNLSKNGKNVVVLMLDRAMSEYIPYIFNEKPELQQQFDGFTFYSNTISFGTCTNYGAPGVFGGYEYTPVEMNKRNTELLVAKHNEALKVMPVLFSENDYEVTVCDPPYANYQWVPDLSIYDEYPEIDAYITDGRYNDVESSNVIIKNNLRNFFCFSIMKVMPLCVQEMVYNEGTYNQAPSIETKEKIVSSGQIEESPTVASGVGSWFMNSYNVLVNLPNITRIVNDDTNTFVMMSNNTTHEPTLLQEPLYEPMQHVDNTEYYTESIDRFTVNGVTLKMENSQQIGHYHVNMAAMIQLGKWFDYMRENDVYDNTRIIIVADHGRNLYQIDELVWVDGSEYYYLGDFNPLLLVKDFNGEGFSVSKEFMTNADVPTIAVKDIIENPVNPFTGKIIENKEKTSHVQYISLSREWEVEKNNGNTFIPGRWFAVSDGPENKEAWRYIEEECVLPELKK